MIASFGVPSHPATAGGSIEREQTVADQDADRCVGDALGHAPRDQRGVGGDRTTRPEDGVRLHAVAFEHDLAALHHEQREADSVRGFVGEQLVGDPQDRFVHEYAP